MCLCGCLSAVLVRVNHRAPNKYAMKIDYKAREKKAKSFLLFTRLPSDFYIPPLSHWPPFIHIVLHSHCRRPRRRCAIRRSAPSTTSGATAASQWATNSGWAWRSTSARWEDTQLPRRWIKRYAQATTKDSPKQGKHREVNLQFTHRT